MLRDFISEGMTGIEPALSVWKTEALPLSYIPERSTNFSTPLTKNQIQGYIRVFSQVIAYIHDFQAPLFAPQHAFFYLDFAKTFFVGYAFQVVKTRGVAQLGSAFALGAKGRRFKSCHPDNIQKVPEHAFRDFFVSATLVATGSITTQTAFVE